MELIGIIILVAIIHYVGEVEMKPLDALCDEVRHEDATCDHHVSYHK